MPLQTDTTITMPQLGESVVEGTIIAWLKAVGEYVEEYDPLVEVETDKATGEVPSPCDGVLTEILIEPGTTVPVGAALCRIEPARAGAPAAERQPNGSPPAPSATGRGRVGEPVPTGAREIADEAHLLRIRSSPVVRRLADEHGVDIGQIKGSGIDGRVTKKDILAYVAGTGSPVAGPAIAPQPEAQTPKKAALRVETDDEVIPVSPMRRRIAAHMVESVRTAPQATVVMEVDMTRVVQCRDAHKAAFQRREGVSLTYMPFVIKAVTTALRAHPRLNAVWDEERIIQRNALNIGIAIALEDGLIVPVILHADRLSIAGLMHAVADLAGRAHDNTFTADDLAGGTFTVNNPGTFGSLVSTPILPPQQVAILSMEAIIKRPVVIDDMIAVRSMMNLSLTIDHRALDGLAAARFLQHVRDSLESVSDDIALY